jgi:hypothetical protein
VRAREKKDLIKARYKKRRRRVGKQRRHGVRMRRWYKKGGGERCLASHSVESGGDIFYDKEAKKKKIRNDPTNRSDKRLTLHVTEYCV